jgi:serine/threonine-protein kinase
VCGLDGERLVEDDVDPLVERTLGDYRIVGTIGDGGMARVYRAVHVKNGAPRALKVLFGQYAADPVVAERFRREVQAAMMIRHENVVAVEGQGEIPPGVAFMVMELIEGETLADTLARESVLTPKRAGDIAAQIASGLVAAHTQGFIHRDLKPKNVMLAAGGPQRDHVKLVDFGLVGMVGTPLGEVTQLTATGLLIGTPAYMSPEQILGAKVSPLADLYSLGVILYEMLTGRVPFEGARTSLLTQHLTQEPPTLPPSEGLEQLTMRLLEKDPADRPTSALEVVESLEHLGLARKERVLAAREIAKTVIASAVGREQIALYSWQESGSDAGSLRADLEKRLREADDAPITNDTVSEPGPDRSTDAVPAARMDTVERALVALPIPVGPPSPERGDTVLDSARPEPGDAGVTTVDSSPFFEAPPDLLLPASRNGSTASSAPAVTAGRRPATEVSAALSQVPPEAPTQPLGVVRPVRRKPPLVLVLLIAAATLLLIGLWILIAIAPNDSDPVVLAPESARPGDALVIPPVPSPSPRR